MRNILPIQTKKLFLLFLPLNDNEGNPFPEIEFANVVIDIRRRFGGLTWMRPTHEVALLGEWVESVTGTIYRDELIAYFVVADATSKAEDFFAEYKSTLMTRFRQKDIFMLSFLVDIY